MGFANFFLIVIAIGVVLLLGALIIHKINPHAHVDWDTYVSVYVAISIIIMILGGLVCLLKKGSEEVRIGYLQRSQYAACLRVGNSQEECVKIVGSTGEED